MSDIAGDILTSTSMAERTDKCHELCDQFLVDMREGFAYWRFKDNSCIVRDDVNLTWSKGQYNSPISRLTRKQNPVWH